MILVALVIFLLVVVFSYFIYFFCKRVIYKLNRRVLARNLAVLKNGPAMQNYNNLTVDEIRERLIVPFFLVLGYNTYDSREFKRIAKFNDITADYVTKKWNKSKLCKRSLYIKYINFNESDIDLEKQNFNGKINLDELMDKMYFKGEYYILTNGYIYLFYSAPHISGSKKFDFCFNVKSFSKKDISQLAYYTKQYMFLEVADVFVNY